MTQVQRLETARTIASRSFWSTTPSPLTSNPRPRPGGNVPIAFFDSSQIQAIDDAVAVEIRSGKDHKPDRLGGDDGHFPFGTMTVAG